jgi:hypothetical protein
VTETPQALLSLLVEEFERRRWADSGAKTALRIVRAIEQAGGKIDFDALARIPQPSFFAANRTTRADVRHAIERALRGAKLAVARPALVPIEGIDSFAAAATVRPQQVASLAATKLPLPERTVKEYVNTIVGEPYAEKDWGGELSDILTSRVILDGARVSAAFLLKGDGSKQKLKPRDLGANGDQIRRLAKQTADIYVVQHVGQFDESVYDAVRDMVTARRAERGDHIVGSVWDGSDCARLFVAHGLIDPATGAPLV